MPEVFPTRFTHPLTRELRFTTRTNRTADATEYRNADQANPLFRWDLSIGPLADADYAAIQNFHSSRGGAYETFVFLDPLDNLLQWSEDFSQAAWVKSNPSQIVISAPTITNTGGSVNTVSQSIAANPQGITFTASVWLRGAATITLRLTDGAGTTFTSTAGLTGAWQRYSVSGTFVAPASSVTVAFDIPAGASADFLGAQLAATSGPGAYSRTTLISGFHPKCSFDSQPLAHRVAAPNVNFVKLSILEHA